MFESWSVGKPQILVQVSVEKKQKKKQRYLSKKKMTKQFYIFTNEKYSTCIYRYMYCKLKQQLLQPWKIMKKKITTLQHFFTCLFINVDLRNVYNNEL